MRESEGLSSYEALNSLSNMEQLPTSFTSIILDGTIHTTNSFHGFVIWYFWVAIGAFNTCIVCTLTCETSSKYLLGSSKLCSSRAVMQLQLVLH